MAGGPPRRSLILAALVAAPLAAGCTHTTRVGRGGTLQMSLSEYRLRPNSVATSSGTLTIVAHNYGLLTHNLAITQGATTFGATKPIAPGGSATLTVTLPPGTYTLKSTILSDDALGENGTLTVSR